MTQAVNATCREPGADVIVVGWKRAACLVSCLESVLSTVESSLVDVLVVLNQPAGALQWELGSRFGSRIKLWTFRSNLGFGGAINFAARQGNREHLVLLNDDSTIEAGWLQALLDTAQRRPRAGAIGSTLLNPDGSLQEAGAVLWSSGGTHFVGRGDRLDTWCFERKVDYCSGASLLVRRSAWESVGEMDERYYPGYNEDVDYCLRLAEQGWEAWYQPLSRVRHVQGASTTPRFRQFLVQRNGERFVERWSDLLATREPPGMVESAIWKAMGCPYRVLVLADGEGAASRGLLEDVLQSLAQASDAHVALHGASALQLDLPLVPWGVRVVEDLDRHLRTSGIAYDVVVDIRLEADDRISRLVERWLPGARGITATTEASGSLLASHALLDREPADRGVDGARSCADLVHLTGRRADGF